jgi:hypothetical protein
MSSITDKEYTYMKDGQKHGPFSLHELGDKAVRCEIPFNQFVSPVDGEFAGFSLTALPVPNPVYRQTLERMRKDGEEWRRKMKEAAIPAPFRGVNQLFPYVMLPIGAVMLIGSICLLFGTADWAVPILGGITGGLLTAYCYYELKSRYKKPGA